MAEEVNAGAAAAGGASGASGGSSTAGGSSAGAGDASLSDSELLERAGSADAGGGSAAAAAEPTKKAEETGAPEEVNLAALEEGQPEWLAKVTDETAKTEIGKLLAAQKKFSEKFKDEADLDAFFKDLPGGREQVAALQTLQTEVIEIDGHIAANTPESNAKVVERYLGEAPDKGVGLFRAGAQHLAKTNPEGWKQLGGELLDSTLKAAGIGTDSTGLLAAISEMREAVQAQDGEALGQAVGKLIGAPKAAPQADPNLTKAQQEAQTARTAERTAKVQVWETQVNSSRQSAEQHIRQSIGTALSVKDSQGRPLLPASIPQKSREELVDKIYAEVDQQLGADSWLISKIGQLIGTARGDKQNLAATKEDFAKALEMFNAAATPLVKPAMAKIISEWSRNFAASNREAIDRAKGGAPPRKDVGSSAPGSAGRPRITADDIVGPKAKSDKDILDSMLN